MGRRQLTFHLPGERVGVGLGLQAPGTVQQSRHLHERGALCPGTPPPFSSASCCCWAPSSPAQWGAPRSVPVPGSSSRRRERRAGLAPGGAGSCLARPGSCDRLWSREERWLGWEWGAVRAPGVGGALHLPSQCPPALALPGAGHPLRTVVCVGGRGPEGHPCGKLGCGLSTRSRDRKPGPPHRMAHPVRGSPGHLDFPGLWVGEPVWGGGP